MKNVRVYIGPFNEVILETWDRSYELEIVMTPEEAVELGMEIVTLAAEAHANSWPDQP